MSELQPDKKKLNCMSIRDGYKAVNNKVHLLLLTLVLVVTAIAYFQVINCGYVSYDDAVYVIENDNIKTGFNLESIKWAFLTRTDGNWFPLTWLSYMLDVSIGGSGPRTYHIANLIYHLINCSLVFTAFYMMTGRVYRCVLVAALFALHPLHVESVAWISERKDLLSTFFFFLTIISYAKYREQSSVFRYVATLFLFICGLMSKSMLVTVPLLFLLLDYWPYNKYSLIISKEFRTLLIEKIPFLALSLLSGIITYNVQKHKAVVSYAESPFITNLENAAISYVMYIYKTFVPINLSVIYPFPAEINLLAAVLAALVLLLVSAAAIILKKKSPYFFVGWFWYLIALLPVIGIIRVGKQSMADRYTYIPLTGFFVLFVWGVAELRLIEKISVKIKAMTIIFALVLLSVVTRQQVSYWKSSMSLFTHSIAVTDKNWVALGILGYDYITNNELAKAMKYINMSLALNPKNVMALFNMGILQNKLGCSDLALQQFQKVVAIEPDYRLAHYQIGLLMSSKGDTAAALNEYSILTELDPTLSRQLLSSIRIQNSSAVTPVN